MRASLYSGASRGRARGLTALHFPAAVAVLALLAAFAAPPVRAQAGGSGGLAAAGGRIEFCLLTASAARTSATDCSDPRKLASLGAGSVIDAPAGSPLLNIRAAVTGVAVASVFFEISGPVAGSGTENVIPYDVFGDRGGHAFPPGDYTLEATVYDGSGRTGTVTAASTIAFSIRGRLGPPRELQTVSGPRQVNVGWRAPDTAREVAHYELRWAKAGAAWGRWHRKEVGANERELYRYRVDGLDGGAEYRFEVRAMAAASGTPEPGESAVVTGTPVVLGAPRSLEADAGHERVGGCPRRSGKLVATPARLWYQSGVFNKEERPPMKKPYKIVSGASTPNSRELADWLAKDGQLLIPLVELLEKGERAIDEVIDVMGRATIEAVLQMSAAQVAGPKEQGRRDADREVYWHGVQAGRVALKER